MKRSEKHKKDLEKQFATVDLAYKMRALGFNEPCLALFSVNHILCFKDVNDPILNEGLDELATAPLWQQIIDFLGFGNIVRRTHQ